VAIQFESFVVSDVFLDAKVAHVLGPHDLTTGFGRDSRFSRLKKGLMRSPVSHHTNEIDASSIVRTQIHHGPKKQ
jgi:hypothetical protein